MAITIIMIMILIIKAKIKFLLALSCIALSCNHLTQPPVLNIKPEWMNKGQLYKPKINRIEENNSSVKRIEGTVKKITPNYVPNLKHKYDRNINQKKKRSRRRPVISNRDKQVKGPLASAVFSESPQCLLDCIELFKNNNIQMDINAPVLYNKTIFEYAIDSRHKEMVKVLIEEAPQVHIYGKDKALDLPALLDYAIHFGTEEIIKVLMDAGADPNLIYDRGEPLKQGNGLMLAELYDRKDIAIYFISNNLIKNWNQIDDRHGQTALMRIAFSGHPGWSEVLAMLLQKGVDIIVRDRDGQDVLMRLLERYIYIYNNMEHYGAMVCNDKKKMLSYLCAHEDISNIINDQNTQNYVTNLLNSICILDKNEAIAIYHMLRDAGLIM